MSQLLSVVLTLFVSISAQAESSGGGVSGAEAATTGKSRTIYKFANRPTLVVVEGGGQQSHLPSADVEVVGGTDLEGQETLQPSSSDEGASEEASAQSLWGDHVAGSQPTVPPEMKMDGPGYWPPLPGLPQPTWPKQHMEGPGQWPEIPGLPQPTQPQFESLQGSGRVGDHVLGPQSTVPPAKVAQPDPPFIRQSSDRPWIGLQPPNKPPLKWNRIAETLKMTHDQQVQILVTGVVSAAMLAQMTRMLFMKRFNVATAIMPPAMVDEVMGALGAPDTYMVPQHEKYTFQEVIEFMATQPEGEDVNLNDLEPEFAQYLMEVIKSLESQRFYKAFQRGHAA